VRPISPHTIELIESLSASASLLSRWLRRVAPPSAAVLDEIVASGEIEAALALLALAVGATPHHREPLYAALDRLVRGAPPSALLWLEQRGRTLSEWRRQAWAWSRDVTPKRIRSFQSSQASAAGIASMHNDGFVREAAVEVLAASDDPLAVPFLLIRANDWVAPVREAAARGIQTHLSHGAARFVPCLELVDRLKRAGRGDLRPLAEGIVRALATPAEAPALRRGCSSASRTIRRRCFGIAFTSRMADLASLVRAGLEDPDGVVRALTAKGAIQALEWRDLEPFIDEMLTSRTPAVRFSALEAIWKHRGTESRAIQERLALDPHPHVRGTALWVLRSIPEFRGAAFYRAALGKLAGGPELVGAIEGLGEVGSADDAALITPFLQHGRARVRTAAVHALASVGSKADREAIVMALSDPSPRVCRAACRVLLRGPPLDPERLIFAALRSRLLHVRSAAIDLARAHPHWVAANLLLRIAATGDAETAHRAGVALAAWEARYNRVFTKPSPRQVEEFESLLDTANLDDGLRSRLRALVPALRMRSS